ncbi:MAG: hypothetical protein J2P52_04315, partial [Blastocatellia bacterium]|nr:hypothetical protein [Blastocatellia bacterium]
HLRFSILYLLSSISAVGLNYAWILQDLFQISNSSRVTEGIDKQPAIDAIYYDGWPMSVRDGERRGTGHAIADRSNKAGSL